MGWGYCGVNTDTGEEMGYTVPGVCAEGGCTAEINHGLAYLCGSMHQDGESCNRYFCGRHLFLGYRTPDGYAWRQLCRACAAEAPDEDEDDVPVLSRRSKLEQDGPADQADS